MLKNNNGHIHHYSAGQHIEQGKEVLNSRDIRETYGQKHTQPGVMLKHQKRFLFSCMRAMLVIIDYDCMQKGIIYAQRGSDHVQKGRNKALANLRWVNQAGGRGQCGRQSWERRSPDHQPPLPCCTSACGTP